MMKRTVFILPALSCLFPAALRADLPGDSIYKCVEMEQVVVTGTRTPKLLANTPVLTKLITASDIAKADATNLRDLLQQVLPGVEFSYAMNQQVHMNFSGFGGQSMLILVDGERLAGETMDDVDFSRLCMDNVDHIEIVKGAASALYGSNAAGGVINIITKNGIRPFALNLNARLGRHHEQRYGLSWQQGAGRWNNLLTVNQNRSDNYDVHNGDNPVTRVVATIYGDATWNFKEQLSYRPSEKLSLTGRAGYFYRQLVRTSETPERYRDFSGGLRGIWKPDTHNSLDLSYAFDQYDKSDYQRITRLDIRDYSNVQNSLRLLYNHTFGSDDVLSLGADYMHDYLFNTNLEDRTRRQDSFDAFAQYDWNVSRQWEAVGALRYDYFSDGRISRLTPKVSVRYQPVHNLNFRASYGMGFRAPTLKEKYYNFDMAGIWIVEGNPALKPEVSHNFNLSADYTHRHYNFTLAAYYNRIRDKIATGAPFYKNPSDRIPHLPYLNLDDYSVSGGEATAQARWPNGLTARLSYAYTHERLPKDKNSNAVNNQYIPARKHSMTGHIDWDRQFSTAYGLNIGLDGRFLSAVDNQEFVDYYDISKGIRTIHYPAYALFKLSLVQRIGKAVKASVILDNLFNYKPEYYYLNCPLTDGTNLMVGLSVDVDKFFKF
ncbi:TonB-dependent receptor plug domain-containing protein [Prevotella denticola]|uniref:TonB-dependent receptor plug domain-containing protein n=1 Tax=Prevotella denticola TaxID=28129 RepID=UPI000E58694D|nr:TonB-dependent receptor [Prevotella denticola]AXV50221.1 TonB-dependent receptor [Prevotella denticola]